LFEPALSVYTFSNFYFHSSGKIEHGAHLTNHNPRKMKLGFHLPSNQLLSKSFVEKV